MSQLEATFHRNFRFTGRELSRLMRRYRVTIRELKNRTGITMKRIRQLRKIGVSGFSACDLYEAITGSLSPRMKACFMMLRKEGA